MAPQDLSDPTRLECGTLREPALCQHRGPQADWTPDAPVCVLFVNRYSAPLYVDIEKSVDVPSNKIDEETGDLMWVPEEEEEQDDEKESRHFIGYVRQLSSLLASYLQQLTPVICITDPDHAALWLLLPVAAR